MVDLVTSNSVSVSTLMSRLANYKRNPAAIQRIILDYLAEIVDGKVNIVDPSNPFIFLMGAGAVESALAINENMVNLRRQYAKLSQTPDEVYMHMSDADFVDRFAIPAETEFTLVVQTSDIINKLPYDPSERCYKGIIPRDTEFQVDGIYYTLQYPIVIRKFENGSVEIRYDAEKPSPIQTLTTNNIDYVVRTDPENVKWVFFKVKVKQFKVIADFSTIQETQIYSQDINFDDSYYYARVYYRNASSNGKWIEIQTTHSDQVYDINVVTALLKVIGNKLNVTIPLIYTKTGKVSGEIRVDVYSTKGKLNIDYSSYKLSSFAINLRAIDEDNDFSVYSNTFRDLTYYSYCDQVVDGGKVGLNFNELRERTIFNSNGPKQLPITNVNLEAEVQDMGFELIPNIDVITNRVFLASRNLSPPRNEKLLTAANLSMSTLLLSTTQESYNGIITTVGNRTTIKSNALFENKNGVITLVNPDTIKSLSNQAIVSNNSTHQYLYNPFYYVIDASKSELEVRAYNLDYPDANNLNFISQNSTLSAAVNTGLYAITKIKDGYRLTITTKSGTFYKQIPDSQVSAQISYIPDSSNQQAFIKGELVGTTSAGERVWQFDIITNYNIDSNNLIEITNASMLSASQLKTQIPLDYKFNIYHTTNLINVTYVSSASDALIPSFMLPAGSACITHETINLTFGEALKNLWTRSRTLQGMTKYKTYPEDIPLVYNEDIFDKDPITGQFFDVVNGEIVYRYLHRANEPVLMEDGTPVYKHRKGDVILDEQGNPVTDGVNSVAREIDILLIDGKYFFATDPIVTSYRAEIVGDLVSWIVNTLGDIQKRLLEKTKIFYYPKTSLSTVVVEADGSDLITINAEQSLSIDLMVPAQVYNDLEHRKALESSTIQILDAAIAQPEVNIKNIEDQLKVLYNSSVTSFRVYGLGGEKNYTYIRLRRNSNQLCLRKRLIIQPDNSIVIKEDVTFNFIKV